jgi:hypothetical protein
MTLELFLATISCVATVITMVITLLSYFQKKEIE